MSGGLDSTVALAWALKNCPKPLHAAHFHYGQTHLKEVRSAEMVCAHYQMRCNKYSIPMIIRPGEVGHLLKGKGFDPRAAHETVKDQLGEDVSATFVPGRNIIFLAYAGSLSDSLGFSDIVIGVNAVDYSGYPDCRPKFIQYMNEALSAGLRNKVFVNAPIITKSKADIIRLGMELGAPLQLTWSCYAGGPRPCGACPSCVVRAKGFAEAKVEDPAL